MTRVFFVADDAGFHPRTDDAILRCARVGVVRGASVVANGAHVPALRDGAAGLDANLELGWHVNLTEGRAVAGVLPSLTDARGRFRHTKRDLWAGAALDAAEVRAELEAQARRLEELGLRTARVDGHNHVHLLPVVHEALRDLVGTRRVRTIARADLAFVPAEDGGARAFAGFGFMREPTLARLLADLPRDGRDVEFMVHPGARPGTAFTESADRERECGVLCDARLPDALRDHGFEIAESSCTSR